MGISVTQLLIVLAIVILLFGTKRLRNIGSDMGSAIRSFRKAVKDDGDSAKTPQDRISDKLESDDELAAKSANSSEKHKENS